MKIDKEISVISIIDANNKEVFLNFKKLGFDEAVTPDHYYLTINGPKGNHDVIPDVFINGYQAKYNTSYYIDTTSKEDEYFLISCTKLRNTELIYDINYIDTEHRIYGLKTGKVIITENIVSNNSDNFTKNATSLTDTNSSFMLLRTNPKLSGNIKLVVDSKQHMYMDTFKVNEELNKYTYRRQSISANSNYNTDVRNCFKNVSTNNLYAVPADNLKAHTPFTEYEKQFDTTYSYGAETNDDELYTENFKILAPLWINRNLPDFFVIFKIEGAYNTDSYLNIQDDLATFKRFLRNAKVVKSFDMRQSSPVGKYLRNYTNKIQQYPGSVLLQFKEQETGKKWKNGINSWIGISLDSGLITKKDETSYMANEVYSYKSQERLNQYIINGFQRNRILCPNIINFEFMFDDETSSNYEMNRYFGLYMTENDFLSYDYIESVIDPKNKNTVIKKYDEDHNEINDDVVSSSDSKLYKDSYKDRMIFAIGPNNMARIQEPSDLNKFLRDEIINMPYKNFLSTKCEKIVNNYKNFMSFKLDKPIRYGEHLRIIIPTMIIEGINHPIIVELIASNDENLLYNNGVGNYINFTDVNDNYDNNVYYRETIDKDPADPDQQQYYYRAINGQTFQKYIIIKNVKYINEHNATNNVHYRSSIDTNIDDETNNTESVYPYILRIPFYTQSFDNKDVIGSVDEQLQRIYKAIDIVRQVTDIDIFPHSINDTAISIMTNYDSAYLQHITADILDNDYITRKKALMLTNAPDPSSYIYCDFEEFEYDECRSDNFDSEDTVIYFGNKNLNPKLYPLSYNSDAYIGLAKDFAPINFELLGWRKSSIMKFINLDDSMYEISSVDKLIRNTIVNTEKGFYRINDFNIKEIELIHDTYRFNKYTDTEYAKKMISNIEPIFFGDPSTDVYQYAHKLLSGKNVVIDPTYNFTKDTLVKSYNTYMNFMYNMDNIMTENVNTGNITVNVIDGPKVNYVMSPFHLDKYLIDPMYKVNLTEDIIDFYSASPLNISLMGLLPVKDIDTQVGVTEKKTISSDVMLSVPKNTDIYIDRTDVEYSIKSNTYYTLVEGHFNGIDINPGMSFIIINDTIYYTPGGPDNKAIKSYAITNNRLTTYNPNTAGITKISTLAYQVPCNYDIIKKPMDALYYFNVTSNTTSVYAAPLQSDMKNDLKYSLVTPTVCTWKGTGMYYDGDSILNIDNINKNRYKYIANGYMTSRFDYVGKENADMYVSNSLNDMVRTPDGSVYSYREYLLNTDITDTINMFVSSTAKPTYTVGYYNKYINTLEFILNGVKFSMTFNNNQIIREVQLSNYNKYEIYIINDFTGEKNEIIINTLENIILIINHNFNYHKFNSLKSNTLIYDNDIKQFNYNNKYTWFKTDKTLDLLNADADTENIYIPVDGDDDLLDDIIFDKYYQINVFDQSKNIYSSGSNFIFMLPDIKDTDASFVKLDASTSIYNTIDASMHMVEDASGNYIVSDYIVSKTKINPIDKIVSEKTSYIINPKYKEDSYMNSNISESEKYDLMIKDYIQSMSADNMILYIKTKNHSQIAIHTIEQSKDYMPILLTATTPANIKYNVDFYNPNFINMIDFNLNESDDIIKLTGMNCIFANTSFKDIKKIKNYYGFKIFNDNKPDLSGTTTNMFYNDEQSLVASNWDMHYYKNYIDSFGYKFINGYIPGIEDKSFFGSKCIKLKDIKFVIDNWNNSEVNIDENSIATYSTELNGNIQKTVNISINLTKAFFHYFVNHETDTFKRNWLSFNYDDTAINNYIKKTLIYYFKINNKNNFKLYAKVKNDNDPVLNKVKPVDSDTYTQYNNFESTYTKVNDEIILNITLKDLTKQYYMTYDLKSNI